MNDSFSDGLSESNLAAAAEGALGAAAGAAADAGGREGAAGDALATGAGFGGADFRLEPLVSAGVGGAGGLGATLAGFAGESAFSRPLFFSFFNSRAGTA